jgi:hypothetical protein
MMDRVEKRVSSRENLSTRQDNSITIARVEQAQQTLAQQQSAAPGPMAPADLPSKVSTDNKVRER